MLNWTQVLNYIKGRMALPSSFIEKTDAQIKDWVIATAIPSFSQYFPDVEYTGVNTTVVANQHPTKKNHYFFYDEQDLDIYGIKQCFFGNQENIITGHPIIGPFGFGDLRSWALDVFKAKTVRTFSMFATTYQFFPPNLIRILPEYHGSAAIEYEREQPHDLSKIPASMKRLFMDLALAEVMIQIGAIRTMYGDGRVSTPFGDVPLNGEALKNEGTELQARTMDKLVEETLPPVVVDVY